MPAICLVTKAWRGGSAWVAQMIALAIADQGTSVAFIAPLAEPASRDPAHPRLLRIQTPRELVGAQGRVRRVRASLVRVISGWAAVLRMRTSTRVFVFSIPDPMIFTLPLLWLLRISGARVVFIAHDAEPHAWHLGLRWRFVERRALRLAYQLSHVVVALTPTVRDALVDSFHIPRARIVVIPHGPFTIADAGPVPGSRRLLIFGSLRRNKCVLEVIHGVVLARRRGVPVVLVLAGEPLTQEAGYWDECTAAMRADPAGFDVRVGFLADDDLPALVQTVDAFVLAYKNFNSQSGVGVLAALAGRPVIGTRAGGLGEMFDRGMVGEVVNDEVTPEAVAAAVVSFYSYDFERWRRLATAGAERVAASLRWDDIARQYIAVAHELTSPR